MVTRSFFPAPGGARDDFLLIGLALVVAATVGVTGAPAITRLAVPDTGGNVMIQPIAAPAGRSLDLAALHRFAPFGGSAEPGAATVALHLRGVFLARPASVSTAMIAAGGAAARGYRVGATLPGGGILDSVAVDRVVVRSDGRNVILALPGRATGGTAIAASPAGAPDIAAVVAAVEAHDAHRPDRFSLLGSLGAAASDGGFRIGTALPAAAHAAGLLPGDIVERIDGTAVGDPARDGAVFDNAVVVGRMHVDVVRAGRHVAVTVPLS